MISVKAMAERTGYSLAFLYLEIKEGGLKPCKDHPYRIDESEMQRWLNQPERRDNAK